MTSLENNENTLNKKYMDMMCGGWGSTRQEI